MVNVIIDPGHGGIGKDGRYTTAPSKMHVFANGEVAYEGVLNRQIARFVGTYLNAHKDINVVYTVNPDDPRDISLSHRVRVANSYNKKNTIFVSIHCNASPNHLGTGFEIFTTKGVTNSDYLAEDIAKLIETQYSNIGMKLRWDFSDGDRDKEVDFYVLRKTLCPAVLIECGFFDNRVDYDLLKDPCFQGKLGCNIYKGIINYLREKNGID